MSVKQYFNKQFNINLDVIIDHKQNVYFKGREIASLLGYSNTTQAIIDHVDEKYKKNAKNLGVVKRDPYEKVQQNSIFISEPGLYSLIFRSKLKTAKLFQDWVFETVLPSIRKYGNYKLFNNSKHLCFKIEDEYDLHTKVVNYIRRFYPNVLLIAGLGELQDTNKKRIDSWKKGYQKDQPDIIISSLHKNYTGFCIELKNPKKPGVLSDAQRETLKKYRENGYKILVSYDYGIIIRAINSYCKDIRLKCKYCNRKFISIKTRKRHYKYFHKINSNA